MNFHLVVLSVSWLTFTNATAVADGQRPPSPGTKADYPQNLFWGDTHVHTNLSLDAYLLGNRISPDEAFQFAKGEAIVAGNGLKARLDRPLDFLVLADHAENLGLMVEYKAGNPALLQTAIGKNLRQKLDKINQTAVSDPTAAKLLSINLYQSLAQQDIGSKKFTRSVWQQVIDNAERHNNPGKFTTFTGYEWTAKASGQTKGSLHRVVIFKDGADRVAQVLPFSSTDSQDPEALWAYLSDYEKKTGGDVLAIPHNGNRSNGEMFALANYQDKALTKSYAETRNRWEPLYEVIQIKGDSEAHPFLSPDDEFADYETWNSWAGKSLPPDRKWDERERAIKQGEYARAGLKRGLEEASRTGANPFKFGLIGSSDTHTSLAAVDENNFLAKNTSTRQQIDRLSNQLGFKSSAVFSLTAAGYAAVWATENTREALFAAMKRRETYATSGPRIRLRFFGGWQFRHGDAYSTDLANIGYAKGVPMGGDLSNAPEGLAPTFLIRAVKDPNGANLDRVQVIKGWLDKHGRSQEKVYNVVLSDDRVTDTTGSAPPLVSTVDLNTASYSNSIGRTELAIVWRDPDFDSSVHAFYYVRVIEIPTPRWTAFDAQTREYLKDMPQGVPMVTQERAYSSPIWYTP